MSPHCAAKCWTSLAQTWRACLCTCTQTTILWWKGCVFNLRWHTAALPRPPEKWPLSTKRLLWTALRAAQLSGLLCQLMQVSHTKPQVTFSDRRLLGSQD